MARVIFLLTEEKNQPIRNKNFLWWPCLLTDRDEMSILYRGPSIDASYQVSDQLALWFQRRRLKCEKLTDDRQTDAISDGKTSCCLWQGELKSCVPTWGLVFSNYTLSMLWSDYRYFLGTETPYFVWRNSLVC